MADPIDDYMAEVGHEGATAAELGRLMRLTPRELQVLEARTEAETVAAAAHSLGISVSTSETHVKNVFRKLGVSNIVEAYVTLGWLQVPRPSASQAIPTDDTLTVGAQRDGRNPSPSSSGTPARRTTRGPRHRFACCCSVCQFPNRRRTA